MSFWPSVVPKNPFRPVAPHHLIGACFEGGEAVVAEAKTEFDGLFAFADLATGTYLVRVDPAQARQIGLKPSAGKTVELTRDTGVLEGVELTLARARLQPDKERRP